MTKEELEIAGENQSLETKCRNACKAWAQSLSRVDSRKKLLFNIVIISKNSDEPKVWAIANGGSDEENIAFVENLFEDKIKPFLLEELKNERKA